MEWLQRTPKPGDPVRVKVRFYYHYGIFVSPDSVIQFGLPHDPGRPAEEIRVLSTDVYTFLQGGTIEVGLPNRHERRQLRPDKAVIAAAQSRLGQGGYQLTTNNCEHFIYECLFGQRTIPASQPFTARLLRKLGLNKKHTRS